MKKILSVALCALMAVGTASAAKFYINPGHGGHDSNDRPTALPCGVAMFYESDGNLSRGLFLRDMLQAAGHSVKMSRTTNNSSDDLALSTICSQSNSYAGYFASLHTNAANASANYIVSFFRSTSSAPNTQTVSPSKAMALAASKWHDNNHLTNLTYTTYRALGDYSFYDYNLGALRTNNRPGYLVETVFHDYRPDALRLKSDVYNKYTAWQLMRGFIESPLGSGTVKGCIVGDIRDLSKSRGYTNYTARGRDTYKAVEGATVTLYNSSGTSVASMTTDQCENGLYGFFDLAAGTYTVEVKKSGYKSATATVTVSNNASTKKCFDLSEGTDTGISLSKTSVDFGEVTVGSSKSATFTVSSTDISSDITLSSNNSLVTVSPTTITKNTSNQTVTLKYTPTAAGALSGAVTLTSGSVKATVAFQGSAKNPPLTFTEGYNYSETTGKKPSWLPADGWSTLRNMCYGNGKLYVVSPSTSQIFVLKAQTAELLYELDMTGVSGGTFKVMDVKYVDGKVIACNLAATADLPIKIYRWDSDFSQATCILETTNRDGITRMGDTFDYDGDLTNGKFVFCAGGQTEENKVISYSISGGVVSTTPKAVKTMKDDTDAIIVGTSPRAVCETTDGVERYWVVGQNYVPTLIDADGLASATLNREALGNAIQGNDFQRFEFKGAHYAVATSYSYGTTNDELIRDGHAVLLDGTDGWASATALGSYPAAGLGNTRNTSFSTSCPVAVNGDSGVEFWVLVSMQGLAYYKHGTVPTYTYEDPNRPNVSLSASTLDFGTTNIGSNRDLTLSITPSKLEGDVTLSISGANADCFRLNRSSFAKTDSKVDVIVGYYPTEQASHTATLTISSPNMTDAKVTLKGNGKPATEFIDNVAALEEMWVYSTNKNNLPSWFNPTLTDNYTRDVAINGGNLYVLNCKAWGAPTITILDAYKGTSKGSVSVDGISGGRIDLASIDMMGGKLIGSNAVNANHTLILYKWDSESAAPAKWAELTPADILADQMTVTGDMTSGAIWFVATATPTVYKYTVTNGTVNATPTKITLAKAIGSQNGNASVAVAADGSLWVDGKDVVPMHFSANGSFIEDLPAELLGAGKVVGANAIEIFAFGSKTYMTAMTYVDTANTLAGGAIVLIDITGGVSAAKQVGIYPSNGFGTTRNTQFVNNLCHSLTDGGHTLNVWGVTSGQGIAYYKYVGDKSTGIDNILTDGDTNAPVEFYNLQGARVNGENLAPGIYIRRQGNNAKKILVK